MKLFQIKRQGLGLMTTLSYTAPRSLYPRIIWFYHHRLQQKFSELFSTYQEKNHLLNQLEEILDENWEHIKGTALSYTCLHNHPITELMLGIAVYLHKERPLRHESVIKSLMPGLTLESISDHYPDFDKPEYQNAAAVKIILRTHILSEHSNYLIPVRLLVELRPDPNFRLMNPYFNYSDMPEEQAYISESELERLYAHSDICKTLKTEISDYKTMIDGKNHLLGQLRELCRGLSLGSRYGEGSELQAGSSAYSSIIQFIDFYNQLFSKKLYQLSALPDAHEMMNSFVWVDNRSLFYVDPEGMRAIECSHPEDFQSVLAKISEKKHPSTNMMLLNPQELFYLIDKNTKFITVNPLISAYLREEIIRLIDFTSDSGLNLAATSTAETCVATIRQSLLTHISGAEELLASFKLDNEADLDIEASRVKFQTTQAQLMAKLVEETYNFGCDHLENYGKILDTFEIDYDIQSLNALNSLLGLSQHNFKSIFSSAELRFQAVILFQDIDELSLFLLECRIDKLECFMQIFGQDLKSAFLSDISELLKVFILMEPERIAKIFNPIAKSYIASGDDLIVLGNQLSLNAFQIICHTQKELIQTVIKPVDYLKVAQELRPLKNQEFWLNCFFSTYQDGISSTELFHQSAALIQEEQLELVFERNKLKLIADIHNSLSMNLLFSAAPEAKHPWILSQCLDKLTDLANSIEDIKLILKVCSSTFFPSYCEKISPNIAIHTHNIRDFIEIMRELTPEHQAALITEFQPQVVKFVMIEESIEKLIPYQLLFKDGLSYRKLYNQLFPHVDNNACVNFIMSIAFSPEDIAKDLKAMLSIKSSFGLFPKTVDPKIICEKISAFPLPIIKKVHEALGLGFDELSMSERKMLLKNYMKLNIMDMYMI